MNIALIPARSGSKRLPGKNTKLLNGKPLIFYSINAALETNLFTEVIISTDSQEIADIAKSCGGTVPLLQDAEAFEFVDESLKNDPDVIKAVKK